MKIRIKGNTFRLRLLKTEVEQLVADGIVEEKTEFAGKTFVYAIKSDANAEKMTVDFDGTTMLLLVPTELATRLESTKKVGFQEKSGPVEILLEKDFVCIDRPEEDQKDNYPNPKMKC